MPGISKINALMGKRIDNSDTPTDTQTIAYEDASGLWKAEDAGGFSPLDLSPTLWVDASDQSTWTLVPTTAWATSTPYVIGDRVTESATEYICIVDHTSGVFATDLAAGRWRLGGKISQLDDKTTNGLNLTQGTSAHQPLVGLELRDTFDVLKMDGDTDRLIHADNALLDISPSVTLCGWINHDGLSASADEGIISKWVGTGSNRSYVLYWDSSDAIGCSYSSTGSFEAGNNLIGPTTLSFNTWYFVACTIDAGTAIRLYQGTTADNITEDANKTTGLTGSTIFNGTAELWLGTFFSTSSTSAFFDGEIQNALIFPSVLSLAELKQVAEATSP